MRQFIAILLLCSLSVHCAGRLGVVAKWWLNRDYAARVLCENKARPQLHCNGKCQLSKQLRLQASRESRQQPVDAQHGFEEIVLFCTPLGVALPQPPAPVAAAPRYAPYRVHSYAWPQPGPDYPPAES
ncbi:hypothetical protein [Hymenobacter daeguensis]